MKTLKTLLALTLVLATAAKSETFAATDDNGKHKKKDKTETTTAAVHTLQVYNLSGKLMQETQSTTDLMPETLFLFSYAGVDYYILDEKPAYDNSLKPVNL
ncbi:hypothetical protein SAMN05421823_102732 [Catalinimonas alkaloidigena]|uniref:Uncharacterized protein n=1 Tax=Catalinimonas alkaloidigena TaxID=1075417 RepID=A0A1G9BWE5_9BACT|nr:hypothetical protein [Catalinimonas alkaloidigena]SDK43759.1 hypothetical protein SAMN05421823_102732 [Catalinimonas alkaloidigena]